MGRIWVLDTETKGTGANMVPLERKLKKPSGATEPIFKLREPAEPRPAEEPTPREPRRFKVVDVRSGQVSVDDVGAHEAIEALNGFSSIVDAYVYILQPERERWRMLTFGERSELWKLKDVLEAEVTPAHSAD
jgi:hypothetical protein